MLLIEPRGHDGVSARVTTPAATEARPLLNPPVPARWKRTAKQPAAALQTAPQPSFSVPLQRRNTVMDKLSRRPALLGWSVAALFAIVLFAVIHASGDATAPNIAQKGDDESEPASQSKKSSDNQRSQKQKQTDLNSEPADQTDQAKSSNDIVANKTPERLESVEPEATILPVKPDAKPKPADNAPPKPSDAPTLGEIKPAEPRPNADNPPPEPPVEPDPKIAVIISEETIHARLNQKVARFDQSKPVPLIKLLDVLEDLTGVPIVWDLETVDDKQLQKNVSLKQQQTTVGEILDAVLKQVGLSRRTGKGQIELVPNKAEANQ